MSSATGTYANAPGSGSDWPHGGRRSRNRTGFFVLEHEVEYSTQPGHRLYDNDSRNSGSKK